MWELRNSADRRIGGSARPMPMRWTGFNLHQPPISSGFHLHSSRIDPRFSHSSQFLPATTHHDPIASIATAYNAGSVSNPARINWTQGNKLTEPHTVWASLITNMDYLPGLLTLYHSLYNPKPDSRAQPDNCAPSTPSRYSFVAFYTSTFPPEGLKALQSRGIRAQWVPSVTPASSRSYTQDPRFAETWNKLVAFSLTEYERVVLLDGDILVRRNMDELMELELDGGEGSDERGRVFAAAHACACNPLRKAHYPETWFDKPFHTFIYQLSSGTNINQDTPKLRLHNPTRRPRPRAKDRSPQLRRRRHAK